MSASDEDEDLAQNSSLDSDDIEEQEFSREMAKVD